MGFAILLLIVVFIVYNIKLDNDALREKVHQERSLEEKRNKQYLYHRIHADEFREHATSHTEQEVKKLINSQAYKEHMAQRDPALGTNWQQVHRESG